MTSASPRPGPCHRHGSRAFQPCDGPETPTQDPNLNPNPNPNPHVPRACACLNCLNQTQGDCIPPHVDHHDFLRPFCTLSLLSEQCIMFAQVRLPVGG